MVAHDFNLLLNEGFYNSTFYASTLSHKHVNMDLNMYIEVLKKFNKLPVQLEVESYNPYGFKLLFLKMFQ